MITLRFTIPKHSKVLEKQESAAGVEDLLTLSRTNGMSPSQQHTVVSVKIDGRQL